MSGERFLAHPDRALLTGAALLALVALTALLVPAEPRAVDRVARSRTNPMSGERFLAHPDRALLTGAALLALVALTALLVPAEPLAVDRAWSEAMKDIQTPALEHIALVFNALGRGLLRGLSLAAIGIVLLVARRWLALLAFAVIESLTPLLSTVLKHLVDRQRPPDGLVHPTSPSFPSGHAAYAGATCIALVLLFTAPGPRRLLWWAIAVAGIAGMAWSRTYLQVHWLSDVVAGSLLGVGVSLLVFGGAQHWATGRRVRTWNGAVAASTGPHR